MSSNPDDFGDPCAGSRWFKGEPILEVTPVQTVVVRWYCPLDGCSGQMLFNGMTWPTGDPGYHHTCNECGFTAAIHGRRYPTTETRPFPTGDTK